ncbi:MAG: cyclic nucleotide-binding domain-containing protein [Clostridiales bacterium]|nr:cyclic nucleotide-binding domain-containing protein [Clostridiales bacterium]
MSTIEKSFSKGEVIIKEGDSGNSFFQILEGNATVYKNFGKEDQVKLTVLVPGQYFGEMAVIETYPRSTTVVADGDVKVIEIPGEELNIYYRENPDKIVSIMKHLGSRLKQLTADYNEAKGLFTDIEKGAVEKKSDSILTKIKKHISFYMSGKGNLSKPSAEALRESKDVVSTGGVENVETYTKGQIIFKQGELGKCMYMVHGGIIGIFSNYGKDNEVKLTELFPVECFGEMGMISDETRSATAVALSDDTTVEIIYADDLKDLIITYPVKVDMILRHLSHRLRNLTYDYFTTCKDLYELYNK